MPQHPPRPLEIGLVNNMPDAALEPTERQFARLMRDAGGGAVRLRLFALPSVPRSESTRARMRESYRDAADLPDAGLDAVIVTGAEPRAVDLTDEPFWDDLAEVIDWAASGRVAAAFSCLAAHAAVLRLDGIGRWPCGAKVSGVFAFDVAPDQTLIRAAPRRLFVPHSRTNGLDAAELERAGYQVLAHSAAVGPDAFLRPGPMPMLLLQGHPEYEADTLAREYLRDLGRFRRGERANPPAPPTGYFAPEVEAELTVLAASPERPRLSAFVEAIGRNPPGEPWRAGAGGLWAGWLEAVAASGRGAGPVRERRTAAAA